MSVYSGFATRAQETVYCRLSEQLVSLLQAQVLFILKGKQPQVTFCQEFLGLVKEMAELETFKYLPPKLSECCRELNHFLSSQDIVTTNRHSPVRDKPRKPNLQATKLRPMESTSMMHKSHPRQALEAKSSQYYAEAFSELIRREERRRPRPPKRKVLSELPYLRSDLWALPLTDLV
jgi:hypothetical protein